MDADIRKSVIAGRYKVDGGAFGLPHYLTGQRNIDEVLSETDIANLYVILAGPPSPNPTELLGNALFAKMIEGQRDHFDYIIIDASPLGSVIDAAIIARYVDGAISYKLVQRVKDQLEKSECRILGVVINKIDMDRDAYYGNYYGKYYGKYY